MSKQLNIHLFNCDRTYKLDVVEKWLNAARVKSKLRIDFEVKQHIFPLSQMTELCSETIPSLQMDVAVFVVHAHESRLSINEENAGIGYAKLYKALLRETGDKVLIVIGGDDSYKDENEEDTAFISRWAKRKISSQFSDEFIDGTKSFIFSWNQNPRAIHEEALVHFLDERRRGKKFEYQPKVKSSQVSERAMSPKADASTWERDPPEKKSAQGRKGSDATGLRTSALRDEPTLWDTYPGASREKGVKGNRTPLTERDGSSRQMGESHPQGGTEPLQSNSVRKSSLRESTPLHTRKEGSFQMNEGDRLVGYHPLQSGTSLKASSLTGYTPLHGKKEDGFRGIGETDHSVGSDPLQSDTFRDPFSGVYPTPFSDTPGGFQDLAAAESKQTQQKDLSIFGWEARTDAMNAVYDLINRYRDVLNLTADTDCLNASDVNDLISHFEQKPLKYCVLVADADKIKAVLGQEGGINLRLLQTADRNVAKGIIIAICCPWFQSEQDKSLVRSAIKKAVNDNRKVFIIWFENGNLILNPNDLVYFLTSCPFAQQASAAAYGPPRSITDKQQLPYPWDYKIYLPSGKTVCVLTRIRQGIISDKTNRPEDVQYWKPAFVVPCEIKDDLYKKNATTSNGELFILMTEKGELICQVNKKDGKDWQNFILLHLDETIVLQTQLRHGKILWKSRDLAVYCKNWWLPEGEIAKLEQEFKETPTADLFIVSDPKGNSRSIVKVGTSSKVFTFVNTVFNQAAGKKVNLI